MRQDLAHGHGLIDEGDDPDLAAALGAQQREDLIDAGKQQGRGVSRRPAMDRLFGCLCRLGWGARRSGWRGGGRRSGWARVPLVVNRTLVRKGEERQLVYYWFQQRGR